MVGPPVDTHRYELCGQTEPQNYCDGNTIGENILGIKNTVIRNHSFFDTHVSHYIRTIQEVEKGIKDLREEIYSIQDSLKNAKPTASMEQMKKDLADSMAKQQNLSSGAAFTAMDLTSRMVELEKQNLASVKKLEAVSKSVALIKNQISKPQEEMEMGQCHELTRIKERIKVLEEESNANSSRNLFAESADSRLDLFQRDLEQFRSELKMDLSSSKVNEWLKHKLNAFLDSPEFELKMKNVMKNFSACFQVRTYNMSADMRNVLIGDATPELRKLVLECFDSHRERIKRMAQEGMCRKEDLPSAWNMTEAKRSLGLALKADLANGWEIISKMVMSLLDGIEQIFEDPLTLDQQELKAMDLILGGKMIWKFFTDLPKSDECLIHLIDDVRMWEVTSPAVKKDKLNALIVALKDLKAPVVAADVIKLVQEGIPTRMDSLIQHLTEMTVKEVGDLHVITMAAWDKMSSRSTLEKDISSTTVVNPVPRATSSQISQQSSYSVAPRMALDKLREELRTSSSALNRP